MITAATAHTAGASYSLRPARATPPPIQAGRAPLQRVAALLSSISHNNAHEGRNPAIIPDSLTSGFVADLVGLTVSDLADSLLHLQQLGVIAPAENGALRLLDRHTLDRLIDAD